jgi:Uma2 family endonuclease
MPALAERYWTAADVRALPDDRNRYECIDGALLVTPTPSLLHQRALAELLRRLLVFDREHPVGELLFSPSDLELEPGTLVQPDLFVARIRETAVRFTDWSDIAALRLAVEVTSPVTARADRVIKREFYLRAGVEEYWIVDLDARLIERWQPSSDRPDICSERIAWLPSSAAAPFDLDLNAFFDEILGPEHEP